MKTFPSTHEIDAIVKRKFRHLTNVQLIQRANAAADFCWDDEGCELDRRKRASGGSFDYKMQGDKLIIVSDQ